MLPAFQTVLAISERRRKKGREGSGGEGSEDGKKKKGGEEDRDNYSTLQAKKAALRKGPGTNV